MIYLSCLLGNGEIYTVKGEIDGKSYYYSKEDRIETIHEIINALNDANDVNLVLHYSILWCYREPVTWYLTSFPLVKELQNKEPEEMKDIFYSVWSLPDGDMSGTLEAYGENNGIYYDGIVEERIVDKLPDGPWNDQCYIFCVDDKYPESVIQKLCTICSEINKYSETPDTITINEKGICFYPSDICIQNHQELVDFLDLYVDAYKLMGRDVINGFELIKWGNNQVSVANIHIDENKKITIGLVEC